MCFFNSKIMRACLICSFIFNISNSSVLYALELQPYDGKKIDNFLSKDVKVDRSGIIFFGIKVEPTQDESGFLIKQGNRKDETSSMSMFSNRDAIIENSLFYDNFPEEKSLSMIFNYTTGGACCNQYIILTKINDGIYGNVIDSGRVTLKITYINDILYTLLPVSDFSSGDSGAGFKPYPYRVLVFERGSWRYGKVGEHKNAYEWLLKETKKEIENNLKRKGNKDFDAEQGLVFPAVEIAFYQVMLNTDENIIISDLNKSLPKNMKKKAVSLYNEAVSSTKSNDSSEEIWQLFKK